MKLKPTNTYAHTPIPPGLSGYAECRWNYFSPCSLDNNIIIGNEEQAREGVKIVKEWCKESNMEISNTKSGFMVVEREEGGRMESMDGIEQVEE